MQLLMQRNDARDPRCERWSRLGHRRSIPTRRAATRSTSSPTAGSGRASTPRPLRGPLKWLGDRLDEPVRSRRATARARFRHRSGTSLLAASIALVAWVIARAVRRRGVQAAGRATAARGSDGRAEDADALEREADEAERDGDLARAVRLRFRAGLLRLGDRGAIHYRPSVTTGEVRRTPRLATVRRTRGHVRSGRRTAAAPPIAPDVDAVAARMAAGARRIRAPVNASRDADRSGDRRPPRNNRRIWIALAVVVGGLLVVNLVAQGLDRAVGGDQPGGATGSSYATAPDGLAAFSSLLDALRPQRRAAARLARRSIRPPPDATVFVLEPLALTDDDAATLLQFVTNGGRLVIGGDGALLSAQPRATDRRSWQPDGANSWTRIDPLLGNVARHRGGRARIVVGARQRHARSSAPTTSRSSRTNGSATARSSSSPTRRRSRTRSSEPPTTPRSGSRSRAIRADRSSSPKATHGYGASRGLAALPNRWKVALMLVAVAALAFVWSRARRFGPPDRAARDLPPARAEYVQALSITLERTHDQAGALLPAQRWARARLATRAGLGAHPNDEELAHAARSFGCTSEETLALLAPVSDDASILALGRAVARVSGDGRKS